MKETRKIEYEKVFSQQNEFGTDEIVIEDNRQMKEEILTGVDIVKLFKKSIREKILFRIKTEDGKFLNNSRFIAVKGNVMQISNPFILFAEGAFPDEVTASFEDDGIDYSFQLKKYRSAGTEREILCHLPEKVTVLRRRGNYRVKVTYDLPVGIYWADSAQEFIGSVNDISEVGIGLKFDNCYFDSDFFNTLTKSINTNYPIILEIDGSYAPIIIKLKYVNKNEDGHVILGSEFYFTEEEQQIKIKNFVDKIKQTAIFQKKKDLTMQLIKAAEMGA